MRVAAVYCLTVQVWAAAPAVRYKGKVQPFGYLSSSKRQRCCFGVMKEIELLESQWLSNATFSGHFIGWFYSTGIRCSSTETTAKVNLKDSLPT
jgi:hypothetical protein